MLIRIKAVAVVLVVAGAVLLFSAIAIDIQHAGRLTGIDARIGHWFGTHRVAALTPFVLHFTNLHGTIGIGVLALALAFLLAWKKQGDWLLTLAIALPCGMLVNVLLKNLFVRVRPEMDQHLLFLSTYSFPSGHVAAATLFYGVLAAYLCASFRAWQVRVLIVLASAAMVFLVALSRLYLGVHYLSDVAAAAAWGTAWLILSLIGMEALIRHRKLRSQRA